MKLLAIIVLIILVGIGGFIAGQNKPAINLPKNNEPTPTIDNSPSPTIKEQTSEPSKDQSTPQWVRTNTLGIVSFEYPYGWHVAVLWPETGVNGINVIIDKEPINTAPRGGSLDDLSINVLNGVPNPEEKLQERINGFKTGLTDASETKIEGLSGKIKYIKGITNLYEELKPADGYFFLIPSPNQGDKVNYQVVSTSIGSQSQKAPFLKHIIESFKREY